MMKKRLLTYLLICSVFGCSISFATASPQSNRDAPVQLGRNYEIESILTNGKQETTKAPHSSPQTISNSDSFSFAMGENEEELIAQLNVGGTQYSLLLCGDAVQVLESDLSGYVGTYEGSITVNEDSEDQEVPVIVDLTWGNGDYFAVVAVGALGSKFEPEVYMFGEHTKYLSDVVYSYSVQTGISNNKISDFKRINQAAIDASIDFQGSAYAGRGAYIFTKLSVFHADEGRNTGNSSIYAKVNTSVSTAEGYIIRELGYSENVLNYVVPDTFNVTIRSGDNNFHCVTNAHSPVNNSTVANMLVPVYLGPTLGVNILGVPITTSKTTVTTSSTGGYHPNNQIDWSLYKLRGFDPDDTEGGARSSGGIGVYSTYTYEGNLSSQKKVPLTIKASVRYEYFVSYPAVSGPSYFYLHLVSDTATQNSSINIFP